MDQTSTAGGAAPEHRPFRGGGVTGGTESLARCRDCGWAQILDEDLHEENIEALFAWHSAHPGEAVDHLALFHVPLAIPGYVQWEEREGLLALRDQRTGGRHPGFNHACLAIFDSVRIDGHLEAAAAAEARRLRTTRTLAMKDVVAAASALYRKGLLRPAPDAGSPRPGPETGDEEAR